MFGYIFTNFFTFQKFEFLCSLINKKVNHTNLAPTKNNYLYELLRVFKYIFFSYSGAQQKTFSEDLHISLPYFKKEHSKNEHHESLRENKVLTIDLFRITFFKKLKLSFKLLIFTTYIILKKIKIHSSVFSSIFIGYVYFERIKARPEKKIYFYGYSYVADVLAFCFFVKESENKKIIFYETANFLDNSNSMVADEISFNHKITSDYAQKNQKLYLANKYKFHHSLNQSVNINNIKSIGYYSEGFYQREPSFVRKSDIDTGRLIEVKLLEYLKNFAIANRNISITIYPHYHRNVENIYSAKKFYKDLLSIENVYLNPPSKKSSETFSKIDLGIVIRSNIFWDRLSKGYNTILISPFLDSKILDEGFFENLKYDINNLKEFDKNFKKLFIN